MALGRRLDMMLAGLIKTNLQVTIQCIRNRGDGIFEDVCKGGVAVIA